MTGASGRPVVPPLDTWPVQAFRPGDRVRIGDVTHDGHHRVPRYAKGRCGRIVSVHPTFPVPDDVVAGIAHTPETVYSVCLESTSVWGRGAEPRSTIILDVWQRFLQLEPSPQNAS